MQKKGKKQKIILYITISIACFALTLVMFMQFKLVNESDLELLDILQETELQDELANWNEKYKEAEQKYQETIISIEEYTNNTESQEETEKLLQQDLQEINTLLGKTDVQGAGIEITLRDSDDPNMPKVAANDILLIVDALKVAAAEAISINEERVVSMTDIVDIKVDIDSVIIKVNGQRVLPPYTIKAIGEASYLESELLGTGGHVNRMQKTGQDATITRSDSVTILKYNNDYELKYIN